jgi:glycosyltransferase involved in cell wall biosynthesis
LKVLIIIPAHNESENLKALLPEIMEYCPFADILLVDDGSTDHTSQVASSYRLPVIQLPHSGVGQAVQAGFLYAIDHNYDVAVQVDADGQHDPFWVKDLIKPIFDDEADFTIGSRYTRQSPDRSYKTPFLRRIGMYYSSLLLFLVTGMYIDDTTSGFRAINVKGLEFFRTKYPAKYPEAGALLALILADFRLMEIPVKMRSRKAGRSMYTLARSIFYPLHVIIGFIKISLQNKYAQS